MLVVELKNNHFVLKLEYFEYGFLNKNIAHKN